MEALKILVLAINYERCIMHAFGRDFHPQKPSTLTALNLGWKRSFFREAREQQDGLLSSQIQDKMQISGLLKLAGKYPEGLRAVLHRIQSHLSNSLEENSSLFFKSICLSSQVLRQGTLWGTEDADFVR